MAAKEWNKENQQFGQNQAREAKGGTTAEDAGKNSRRPDERPAMADLTNQKGSSKRAGCEPEFPALAKRSCSEYPSSGGQTTSGGQTDGGGQTVDDALREIASRRDEQADLEADIEVACITSGKPFPPTYMSLLQASQTDPSIYQQLAKMKHRQPIPVTAKNKSTRADPNLNPPAQPAQPAQNNQPPPAHQVHHPSLPGLILQHPPVAHRLNPHPPVAHSLNPHPPVAHSLNPHPPVAHSLNPHPPVAHSLNPHPPVAHSLNPHPPVAHSLNPHPPVTHSLQPNLQGINLQPILQGFNLQPNLQGLNLQPNLQALNLQPLPPHQLGIQLQSHLQGLDLKHYSQGLDRQPHPQGHDPQKPPQGSNLRPPLHVFNPNSFNPRHHLHGLNVNLPPPNLSRHHTQTDQTMHRPPPPPAHNFPSFPPPGYISHPASLGPNIHHLPPPGRNLQPPCLPAQLHQQPPPTSLFGWPGPVDPSKNTSDRTSSPVPPPPLPHNQQTHQTTDAEAEAEAEINMEFSWKPQQQLNQQTLHLDLEHSLRHLSELADELRRIKGEYKEHQQQYRNSNGCDGENGNDARIRAMKELSLVYRSQTFKIIIRHQILLQQLMQIKRLYLQHEQESQPPQPGMVKRDQLLLMCASPAAASSNKDTEETPAEVPKAVSENPGARESNSKPNSPVKLPTGPTLIQTHLQKGNTEIFEKERVEKLPEKFLSGTKLTGYMRMKVIDWMVDRRTENKALYMAIDVFDRFLYKHGATIHKKKLLLIGSAAMNLSAKANHCSFKLEFPRISFMDDFSDEEFYEMEKTVSEGLGGQLTGCRTDILPLLSLMGCTGNLSHDQLDMAEYIMQCCLLDYDLAHMVSSDLVSISVYLAVIYMPDPAQAGFLANFTLSQSDEEILNVECAVYNWSDISKRFNAVSRKYNEAGSKGISNIAADMSELRLRVQDKLNLNPFTSVS